MCPVNYRENSFSSNFESFFNNASGYYQEKKSKNISNKVPTRYDSLPERKCAYHTNIVSSQKFVYKKKYIY